MRFTAMAVAGAFVVELDEIADERGSFARTFCAETFAARGLASAFPQCNLSRNRRRGTLRGLHYQAAPEAEAKLIRASRGRAFDVALDLRPASPSYLRWDAVELDAGRGNAVYIPEGCAHGFLTLEDECELFYQMSRPYAPQGARGLRYDDPCFAIAWPFAPAVVSARDAAFLPYAPEARP